MSTHEKYRSLLRSSGQFAKFLISLCAFMIGLVGLAVLSSAAGAVTTNILLLGVAITCGLMAGGAYLAMRTVRCPQCDEQ